MGAGLLRRLRAGAATEAPPISDLNTPALLRSQSPTRQGSPCDFLTAVSPFGTNWMGGLMDDFGVGSISLCGAYYDERRRPDSNRKKGKRPNSQVPEDNTDFEQLTVGDSEPENNLGVEDYYTPLNRAEESE